MDAQPGVEAGAISRRRNRLGRSIVQTQLLTSGAVLLLTWITVLVQPSSLAAPLMFFGVLQIFVLTGIALIVPWSERTRRWAVLLPVLDIAALVAIREGAPQLGAGLFLVIPVLWLARNFGIQGAIGGVVWSTVLIWFGWATRGNEITIADFPGLFLLPITLTFVATTSFVGGRRTTGQRILLAQQAAIVKEAFDRARVQESLLDEILNAVEYGVIAFDRNGKVTLMNDAHKRSLAAFNAPRSAIVHPVIYQADRKTPYPQHNRPFARAIAGQTFDNLTFWVGAPGERQVAYSVTSRHLTASDGSLDGGVLVLRDVTAELDAIAARDTLIGSVSHELRSPLTSILGYLELAIDDETMNPETRHMIEISHRNSERLLALVTDLLLAASDADKNLPITLTTTDVAAIVAQAVDAQQLAADERSITIYVEGPGRAIATADPLRIRQVMDNLLTNATKYNRQGGEIHVTIATTSDDVAVSVRDTGLGISDADISHLFDRFFRTESARESTTVGSGLGLSITRDILRQHGGDLTVSSEEGIGSTFTMTIPTEADPASAATLLTEKS